VVKLYSTPHNSELNYVWLAMKKDAAQCVIGEPVLSSLIHSTILDQNTFDTALINHILH